MNKSDSEIKQDIAATTQALAESKSPDSLWVWNLEIFAFCGLGYGLLGLYLYLLPNVSPSSLSLWTTFTCLIASGIMFLAMLYKNALRRSISIVDNSFQGIVNGSLTIVITVFALWLIYVPLVITRTNKDPAIRHQLALLIFPESYPWQGVNSVLGISFLGILTLLYMAMSVTSTVHNTRNSYFFNLPFCFFSSITVVLIQIMANRGIFICSIRAFSWNTSDTNIYSLLNKYWMYLLFFNSLLLVSFSLQMAEVLGRGVKYRKLHCLFIIGLLVLFLIGDSTSSLGKREILGSPPSHRLYHLVVLFSLIGKTAIFLFLTRDDSVPVFTPPQSTPFHVQPPKIRLRIPKLSHKTD